MAEPKAARTTGVRTKADCDDHRAKIDVLIAKSTEMIESLREYRSALITDAGTGTIDRCTFLRSG
ncbi:hypothetical protein ABTW96_04685 [Nocardia beijingensis]|uniref:hypothetical protein n=1 Tax=Nocardia beijingensis TaxID=95162 RepID=UPI00331DACF6